jgi:hypothetical protein
MYLVYFPVDSRSVPRNLEGSKERRFYRENMRRMTVSLDDEIYLSLVNCAANEARTDMSRLSISRTLQKIMLEELNKLNYYPPRTHMGKVGSLVRERMMKTTLATTTSEAASTANSKLDPTSSSSTSTSPLLAPQITIKNTSAHIEKAYSF